MDDFFRLKGIDFNLQKIINPVTFFDVNPINIDQEKELVMQDQDYNPFFIYGRPKFNFDKVQQELHAVEDHDSTLGSLLAQKRDIYIDKCEMLANRGSPKFTVFAKKVYDLPTMDVLEKAIGFLSMESEKEEKNIPSPKAVNILQAEIKHYGFDYRVSEKNMSASAMVLVAKKKIFIKDKFSFSDNFVKRLIIHEIGTHVLRAENGREQPFMIFFHGLPNYLATEEGLAVVNEERFGLLNNENLKNYAARAIAVRMAMNKKFSDIYNYMLEFFPPNTAFRIALRAKRGIADTSRPGGCPKDFVYIDGYLKVKDFLEKGGNLNDLYVGKIGIEHLDEINDIKGLSPAKHLPKNQTFKSLLSF